MIIRAQDLSLRRGQRDIVRGLSFTVRSGEALVLTGPNGAGKTTLLRALAGFLRPSAGAIVLDGADDEAALGTHSHFVGHLNALKPQLTAAENLAFWQRFLLAGGANGVASGRDGAPVSAHGLPVAVALDRFGLGGLDDIPAGYFSAGQKRRLCLARLLVVPRPIWLLDEPSTSLDRAGQAALAQIMGAHVEGGGLLITATHMPLGLPQAQELGLSGRVAAPSDDDTGAWGADVAASGSATLGP